MTSGPQFSSVLLLSRVPLFATPWTEARQASLSITSSQNFLKLVTIESVMPWLDDLRPSEELKRGLAHPLASLSENSEGMTQCVLWASEPGTPAAGRVPFSRGRRREEKAVIL